LSAPQITDLLHRWRQGDAQALDELMPLLYERLRQVARHRLRRAPDGSLNTTELVHETYLKLADSPNGNAGDRNHFLALASRVMRHLLIDHARARLAVKRDAGVTPVPADECAWVADSDLEALMDLDQALLRLEAMNPRQSLILEQRYFGGLMLDEIAAAVGVSLATAKRELRSARAWLALRLEGEVP
jgi:RNA polymerase sigma factor (TIGR02999 family)